MWDNKLKHYACKFPRLPGEELPMMENVDQNLLHSTTFKRFNATKKIMRAPYPSRLAATLVAGTLIFSSGYVTSYQTTRTIKIIVPSAVGGGSDILARLLADQISRTHSLTMVVENRPGASNTIGTETASRAAPDGSTLLINTPEFVINPHLRKLNYDPLTSFTPVCYLARSPQLLVVNSELPYRTLNNLLDAAASQAQRANACECGPRIQHTYCIRNTSTLGKCQNELRTLSGFYACG